MVFSSMTFLFGFLPLVLMLYYISPMKVKNVIILISGIIFYAWGEPFYVIIMLFSTIVDYTAGIIMDKLDSNKRGRLICLIVSIVINLGLLCTFKYGSFLITSVNNMLGANIFDPKLPLPIGISFFTFQSMSYTMDLYMRKIHVQKSIISFTSYVSLFPQIVAGPIVRYADVAAEIDNRTITYPAVASGISIFIRGLAKKMLIANNIGALWGIVKAMDYNTLPMATAWIGILAFTFQIYYDFSGYSDMAIGLGKMLGFNFPINFDHPYVSKSISEFWRRWHITLGSWFRSYVYIPLGGNRGGTFKTVRNLLIVWFLTGLWHGASWNFVIWGVYFGVLIICERLFLRKWLEKIPAFFSWAYTFILVVFGWVLFEMKTLGEIGSYFKALLGFNGVFADAQTVYFAIGYGLIFFVCAIGSTNLLRHLAQKVAKPLGHAYPYTRVVAELAIFAVCICYLLSSAYNPFLYFNF